jgi:hypothetical protein
VKAPEKNVIGQEAASNIKDVHVKRTTPRTSFTAIALGNKSARGDPPS